ncbi:zinc finger protein 235-like [Periplaneta americana]|uniref:zinc finger protein 235-like n=1 Tax=Periplaneta americana TaxID=6978 RepID=UPI0037E7A1CF
MIHSEMRTSQRHYIKNSNALFSDRNFSDQHVTDIKEEYEDQSQDLTSEIKFEEDPVPIWFPMAKREPEEEQRDLDTVNEEPRVEGTAEDNEIFTEWIAATIERSVSLEFDGIAQKENETVCEIPKNSDSSGKHTRSHEDKKQMQFEMSTECLPKPTKSTTHLRGSVVKNAYKCDICGRSFSKSSSVKRHELLHTGDEPLRCDVCGKCFSQSSSLRRHEARHTSEKPFKCDVCGKCFWVLFDLRRHERLHTCEKPFKCDVCGKFFSQSSNLTSHQRVHTGEKPFKCDLCGKYFSVALNVRRHKLVHKGEKPFKCEVCGKYFSQASSLGRHQQLHTGEKPFKCDVCGKRFSVVSSLRRHKLLHIDEKPFKCEVCGKGFSVSSNLRRHKFVHISSKPSNVMRETFQIRRMFCFPKSIFPKRHEHPDTGEKPLKC